MHSSSPRNERNEGTARRIGAAPFRRLACSAAIALCATALAAAPTAWAATTVVSSIAPFSSNPTPDVWYENDVRLDGAASIESLVGLGGNLESAAPLPTGAVQLTTTGNDGDKAEIGVPGNFGLAGDILDGDFALSYGYYKAVSGNAFAAPSIKLVFFNFTSPCPSPSNDCFVTLVYEPTWNQPGSEGSSALVPTESWTDVSISNTSGLFWGTGGFGEPNTAGGPPLRTLDEWLSQFDSSFAGATLVTVSVGVGTFNQDQLGYFDNVSLFTTGPVATDITWDFETTPPPVGNDLFVDFFHSANGSPPVQADYVGVDGADASDGTPVNVNGVDISLASLGTETNGTGLNGRDRGALDSGQVLSDLARDFTFAWGEQLELTLDGLEAGIWEWTGYFHDNDRDQGVATLSVSTDGGATFVYGPQATSHSTTTDPARVETSRIRFLADGSSPVVIRIDNGDLPVPDVRPILNGFDLREAQPIRSANVDLFHASQGGSPVQDGYVGVDAGDASDGSPVAVGDFSVELASGGTESGGSGLSGRDRGALDASQPLSDLARDFAFAWGEDLLVTLDGVGQGTWAWRGYLHDNVVAQGDHDVRISLDGGATFPIGPQTATASTTTNPSEIGQTALVFTTDGSSPIVVKLSNPDLPSPSVRPILSGFDFMLLDTDSVRVDLLDSAKGFSPTQPGFVAVDLGDVSAGNVVDLGSTRLSIASSGTSTLGDDLDGRDRGALAPGHALSPLARDFVFSLSEQLDVTLDGLAPGSYVFSGVFHDSVVDHGAADLSASVDGGATFTVGPVAYTHSTGTDPTGLGYGSIVFEANGLDPVVIRIANPDLPSPTVRPILNGFAIVVPEPSVWLGLLSGMGMLVGLHRAKRG